MLSKDYKGDKCKKCSVDITVKNKSGFCKKHHPVVQKELWYRQMMREKRIGEKNPNWLGSNVGRTGLHRWIKRWKQKPEVCERCNLNNPIDLANISQKYKRDVKDFEWLCRRCHMTDDGRINNLKQYAKKNNPQGSS